MEFLNCKKIVDGDKCGCSEFEVLGYNLDVCDYHKIIMSHHVVKNLNFEFVNRK
jgi:hypothetical protein